LAGTYRFGDSATASGRLAVLAAAFEQSSREFLERWADRPIRSAIDLGCGPGHTTRLLAEVAGAPRTIGLDYSDHFLSEARSESGPNGATAFEKHDVTEMPLPGAPADLLYCRFLLSHLTDPGYLVAQWVTQLHEQGILLLDEVEYVRTRHPVLDRYQEVVVAYLAHYGNRLEIGPALGAVDAGPAAVRVSTTVRQVRPSTDQVATMFASNLAVWRDDAFLTGRFTARALAALEADLRGLIGSSQRLDAVWGIRQIVFRRHH
jgi:trans-aconitate 2-methyltransferase